MGPLFPVFPFSSLFLRFNQLRRATYFTPGKSFHPRRGVSLRRCAYATVGVYVLQTHEAFFFQRFHRMPGLHQLQKYQDAARVGHDPTRGCLDEARPKKACPHKAYPGKTCLHKAYPGKRCPNEACLHKACPHMACPVLYAAKDIHISTTRLGQIIYRSSTDRSSTTSFRAHIYSRFV